jgi:acetoin:2,6-dichlorophenolindophenol oxidoreductase subunit alpha
MNEVKRMADTDVRLQVFRSMTEIRLFEERVHALFLENLVKGTSHLAIGHEAIAAAFGVAMRPDDWTFCTYRGHHHTLARGSSMDATMAEMLGRSTGLLGGKGGSMHLTSVEHGAMGSYAIVGAHLPIAVGAAWSAQARGTEQVAVCFFGDGATNIGAFHEALNMAAVWKLPVVFVCENNFYMEYTPIHSVIPIQHPAADRAASYGLERILVDGNDATVMTETAEAALARARAGERPSLLEAQTYRHGGHSRADPAKYRPQEEVDSWLARDPVENFRKVLISSGVKESVLDAIYDESMAKVEAATEFAKASPEPQLDALLTNVWTSGGPLWRN